MARCRRVAGYWKRFRSYCAGAAARRASRKQLAAWLAREHKADPIHK
jgi:hypothetical protein